MDADNDAAPAEKRAAAEASARGQAASARLPSTAEAAGSRGADAAATDAAVAAAQPEGSCLAYVYEADAELKLNSVVDVIGVLSGAPELGADVAMGMDLDGDMAAEMRAAHPPASQVARVHAILVRPEPEAGPAPPAKPTDAPADPCVGTLRALAIRRLAAPLGGDLLAAEYLLLQCLQQVTAHDGAGNIIGLLPLNILNCPEATPSTAGADEPLSDFGAAIAATLSSLLPRMCAHPLSVPYLNAVDLAPTRARDTGRLGRAALQLPARTALLLDETRLAAGQLGERGVKNALALRSVLGKGALPYDFGVYALDQPAQYPAVVLSSTTSILREVLPLRLPLRPAAAPAAPSGGDELLGCLRRYIAAARSAPFELGPGADALVAEALGASRAGAEGTPRLGVDDLHRLLTLARLVSASHGAQVLTPEHWHHMMALEGERMKRLQEANAAP